MSAAFTLSLMPTEIKIHAAMEMSADDPSEGIPTPTSQSPTPEHAVAAAAGWSTFDTKAQEGLGSPASAPRRACELLSAGPAAGGPSLLARAEGSSLHGRR